jgi:predicted  nucleic acid-binding Zn-ribbon protein
MAELDELHAKVSLLETEIKLVSARVEHNNMSVVAIKDEVMKAISDLRGSIDHLTDKLVALQIDKAKVEGGWWVMVKLSSVIAVIGTAAWAFFKWVNGG